MNDQKRIAWSTDDELDHITKLGEHSPINLDRDDLLAGYLKAADKRAEWNGIDKFKCVVAAREALLEIPRL